MTEENNKFAASNTKLQEQVGNLEGEVNKMTEENKKFKANNQQLEKEVGRFAEQNKQMSTQVQSLTEKVGKFEVLNDKMNAENEKLARIRDGMKEQLAGFDKIKELLLSAIQKQMKDMDEKMKMMDRSLLEKIHAEIEYLDN